MGVFHNSGMVLSTLTSVFHDEVISVDLAKQLLENRPGSRALVLSMECYGCSCRCELLVHQQRKSISAGFSGSFRGLHLVQKKIDS